MGVNLHIDCEGWNECVNGGMKEIFYNGEKFPKTYCGSADDPCDEFRPNDFVVWRKAITDLGCNVKMWMRGLDELEADPTKTIHASY